MNIGIIIYSNTGNTRFVAGKLKERLLVSGHSSEIEEIEVEGEASPLKKDFRFKNEPDLHKYDAAVFGSPVQAFSLNPVMEAYLSRINSFQGKKAACFVTKRLPFKWTGGTRAVERMKKICTEKGGFVQGKGIVIWSSSKRNAMIDDVVKEISITF